MATGSGQNMKGTTPTGRQPAKSSSKGAINNTKVGRKGPPTVTPSGSSQPGKQGKRSSGKP